MKSKYFTWLDLKASDYKEYGNGDSDNLEEVVVWSKRVADKTGRPVSIYEDTGRGENFIMKVVPVKG